MKLNAVILIVVILLCFSLAGLLQKTAPLSAPQIAREVQPAEPVPQFTFSDIAGKKHAISDYTEKIIILNFWASWCPPCVDEFPHLLSFTAANPDIILIALSSDKDAAAVQNFLKRLDPASRAHLKKKNIIVGLDHDQSITGGLFQTVSLPETVIISPDQTLTDKIIGPVGSLEDLRKMLRRDR